MVDYPFTTVLEIMKPCKVDNRKKTQVDKLRSILHSADWMWEEKLDGISIMSIGGRLFSNKISKETGKPGEKTLHMPQVVTTLQQLGPNLILDGEAYRPGWKSNQVVSITNTKSIPVALAKQEEQGKLQYFVYDILRDVDGTWLIDKSFDYRRKRLEELFNQEEGLKSNTDIILNEIHECIEDNPIEAFNDIISRGLEGIVLKSKAGKYVVGKRPMWNQVKMKASFEDDVVITGFLPATKKYTGKNLEGWEYWENGVPVTSNYALGLIGSIEIGKYNEEGNLVTVGSVTGITDELRKDMTENPDKYIGRVIVIKGMEKTEDGKYRHANFIGFHPDKNAQECKLQEND